MYDYGMYTVCSHLIILFALLHLSEGPCTRGEGLDHPGDVCGASYSRDHLGGNPSEGAGP